MSRVYTLCSPAALHQKAAALAEARRPVTKFVNQHGEAIGARNNYPGERHGPLDNGQKANLCIMAREAFERVLGRDPYSADELSEWRREQQMKACGLTSLTHATQAHWPALKAHFLDLKGESGKAFDLLLKGEASKTRVARFKLAEALRLAGFAESYAAVICRQQYKCGLDEANAKQLWRLVFTVRNRRGGKAEGRR